MEESFTHLDSSGNVRMVDVGGKQRSKRHAVAHAEVKVGTKAGRAIARGEVAKGNVFAVARIAGIQAAKRTSDLIPLCHPLQLQSVEIDLSLSEDLSRVLIEASVKVEGSTGVEMEAMTAVSVASLALYDMCKAIEKNIEISRIYLGYKSGGRSGEWRKG